MEGGKRSAVEADAAAREAMGASWLLLPLPLVRGGEGRRGLGVDRAGGEDARRGRGVRLSREEG